jgi:hypothetical protein
MLAMLRDITSSEHALEQCVELPQARAQILVSHLQVALLMFLPPRTWVPIVTFAW